MMEIKKTKIHDLDCVMELYAKARQFMKETGNPNQWGPTHWPPQSLVETDIAQGKRFVCEVDGIVQAVFYCDYGESIEPTYQKIEGAWIGNETYAVIHRIASHPDCKGVGAYCIQQVLEEYRHVRIDTHGDNRVMQHVLEKLGLKRCGIIYVEEDINPRFAYEKMIV